MAYCKNFRFQTLLLLSFPIVIYAVLIVHYSVNVPIWDDFDSILNYLVSPLSQHNSLFSQHNEHRIAWTRFVALSDCYFFKGINFIDLIYVGNLTLLFIFLLFLKIFDKEKFPLVLFIPIPYLLFLSQSWENMTWAMAALQNYSCLLFALFAIYLWNKKNIWTYGAAGLIGTIAAYTSGNGLAVFIVLLCWEMKNLFQTFNKNRLLSPRHLIKNQLQFPVLIILTAGIYYLYFNQYIKPPGHPKLLETLSQPVVLIQYIVMLLGSYVGYINTTLAFVFGLLEIVAFLFLTYIRYDRKNPVIYYYLLFILFTILMIGLGRAGFGVEQALSSRYRIYGIFTLILTYWALFESFPHLFLSKKIVINSLVALIIVFNVGSTAIAVQKLAKRKNILIEGVSQWKHSGKGLYYPSQRVASSILKKAIKQGIYTLPTP